MKSRWGLQNHLLTILTAFPLAYLALALRRKLGLADRWGGVIMFVLATLTIVPRYVLTDRRFRGRGAPQRAALAYSVSSLLVIGGGIVLLLSGAADLPDRVQFRIALAAASGALIVLLGDVFRRMLR